MSSYQRVTKHPETGEFQVADWLDDYFGRHRYGVKFPDGKIFHESRIGPVEISGVGAESSDRSTEVTHWDQSKDLHNKDRRND